MISSSPAQPIVTIGLPVYNSERYLPQSIESLLAQTYRDFVLIICDNASTDGTAEICQRYARQDSRIKYHRNAVNIGLSGNFNKVFELSRSKYFKWSTSDDWWAPDMLKDAVAVLEADASIVVCYPRAVLVDAAGNEFERYDDKLQLSQENPAERFLSLIGNIKLVNHHLGLLRSDAIRRTKLFGKHGAADIGFLAELSLYGKFYEVPEYQFFRRFHEDSSSWKRKDQEQQARRFHAAGVRRVPYNTWRFHWTFFHAVLRGPLDVSSKLGLMSHLLKFMYWARASLYEDLRVDLLGMRRAA